MMDRERMNNPAHWFDENSPDFKNDGSFEAAGPVGTGSAEFRVLDSQRDRRHSGQPRLGPALHELERRLQFQRYRELAQGLPHLKVGYYYERTGKVQQAGSGNYLGNYNFGSPPAIR